MTTDFATLEEEPTYLDAFGCYVWLEDGALLACEKGEFETSGDEYAVEVSAPESQAFLDAVNVNLGTSFVMSEFAGR